MANKFYYANEGHALLHDYQKWSGLEDMAQVVGIWLLAISALYLLSSWWFGRAKKRQFNCMLASLLGIMVCVQFVAVFQAAVRLPRLSATQYSLKPCLQSTKGGKVPEPASEEAQYAPLNYNPCCQGKLGVDLRCSVVGSGGAKPYICRECATRLQIITAAAQNWTAGAVPVLVTKTFCDGQFLNKLSSKYCGAESLPPWGAATCAGAICPMCPPRGGQCETRRTSQPPTTGGAWTPVNTMLGHQRDCGFGQHAHCTKAEPCTPCDMADVAKYDPALGAGLTASARSQGYIGRCRTCSKEHTGDCNFVEGVGPYCKADALGTKIEPCKKCCSDKPLYPFASTNGTCL
jgi:hypothetical protein